MVEAKQSQLKKLTCNLTMVFAINLVLQSVGEPVIKISNKELSSSSNKDFDIRSAVFIDMRVGNEA